MSGPSTTKHTYGPAKDAAKTTKLILAMFDQTGLPRLSEPTRGTPPQVDFVKWDTTQKKTCETCRCSAGNEGMTLLNQPVVSFEGFFFGHHPKQEMRKKTANKRMRHSLLSTSKETKRNKIICVRAAIFQLQHHLGLQTSFVLHMVSRLGRHPGHLASGKTGSDFLTGMCEPNFSNV